MMHDPLFIDPKEIPTGFDYQWVSTAALGDESLGDYVEMLKGGWRPVPAKRHWDLESARGMGRVRNLDGYEAWEYGGLVLVERPKILTTQSRARDKVAADLPIEKMRLAHIDARMLPRSSTNAFHWWPRLKYQLRRPLAWVAMKLWTWWRP
jgi:hypothetical protein